MSEGENIEVVRLTREQLRLLVDSMAIAQWIVCGGEEFDDKKYRDSTEELEQEIYRQAFDLGHTDLIHKGNDGYCYHSAFCMNDEQNGIAWQALTDYKEGFFWEELIDRLSVVFAARDAGPRIWETIGEDERRDRIWRQEERVRRVLGTHGLNGLFITSPNPSE